MYEMPRRNRLVHSFDAMEVDLDDDILSQSSSTSNQAPQRDAANARERVRMRILSSAFVMLKTKLPNIPPDTKLSKLDTLRLATIYIKQLKSLIETADDSNTMNSIKSHEQCSIMERKHHSDVDFNAPIMQPNNVQALTWPFGFHRINQNIPSRREQFQGASTLMPWNGQPTSTNNNDQILRHIHQHSQNNGIPSFVLPLVMKSNANQSDEDSLKTFDCDMEYRQRYSKLSSDQHPS